MLEMGSMDAVHRVRREAKGNWCDMVVESWTMVHLWDLAVGTSEVLLGFLELCAYHGIPLIDRGRPVFPNGTRSPV